MSEKRGNVTVTKEELQPDRLQPSLSDREQVRALASDPEQAQKFEQVLEPSGRQRLDRPFTSGEASAQDSEHRAQIEQERAGRFWPVNVL